MNFLLHQLIDSVAAIDPQREAVCFRSDTLSYGALVTQANQLAHALRAKGVRRRDRVGIFMPKGLQVPVAMYGIMKAGAAYVPLDPAMPLERLMFVLQDCGIRCIVTDSSRLRVLQSLDSKSTDLQLLMGIAPSPGLSFECLDWNQISNFPGEQAPEIKIIEQDLAYIIYTSGSTGQPKGIMHTHHSGMSFSAWAAISYGLVAEDRLSNHAPLHFDLSIFDYFACAVAGATVVIIPEEYTKFAASYSKLLEEQKVSVLFTVPFALIQLLLHGVIESRDLSNLRWVIFGGEPFPTKHLRALMEKLPQVRFDNMYGPAEVNGITHYTLPSPPVTDEPISIGAVSRIVESLVVDEQDRPVDPGEVGELLARTPTMMQGYWNRPDLNAKAFAQRPVFEGYLDTYYRTGDLVRQLEDGCFQFLGRKDRQVKVRGYRIELDEVESVLCSHEAVEEAATLILPAAQGSLEIYASTILKPLASIDANDLLSWLKRRIPWYAVPGHISIRDTFPRTTTGKIDRIALQTEIASDKGNC